MSKADIWEQCVPLWQRKMLQLRWRLRTALNRHPSVYLPIMCLRHSPLKCAVNAETEVVIEGFPRCGNTFAVVAFQMAQGVPVSVAHHYHAPAQIIEAARRGIPTIVLIRPYENAVLSLLSYAPFVTAKMALNEYIRFYRRIQPYRQGYTVAAFGQVTGDFGKVVRRMNAHFGTSFAAFDHSEENTLACFQRIEQLQANSSGHPSEDFVSRPSEVRTRKKKALRCALFEGSYLRTLRYSAERVYRLFESWADSGK